MRRTISIAQDYRPDPSRPAGSLQAAFLAAATFSYDIERLQARGRAQGECCFRVPRFSVKKYQGGNNKRAPSRGPFILNDRTNRHPLYRTSPGRISVRQKSRLLSTSRRWPALAGEPPAIWPGGLLPVRSGMGQTFDFVLDCQFLTFEVVDGYVVR